MAQSFEGSDDLFCKIETLVKVALEPRHTSHPLQAVTEQLHSLLFIYNDSLRGIPICFSDVHFRSGKPYGHIMDEQPWVHVVVVASIIVFKITKGQHLTGRVNKVSDSHISTLVCGIFNASISSDELQKEYSYSNENMSWISSSGSISEGDYVRFQIRLRELQGNKAKKGNNEQRSIQLPKVRGTHGSPFQNCKYKPAKATPHRLVRNLVST
eukprot:gene4542-9012_t